MFDFGGVLTTSPFEAFARYEAAHGLPGGLIRRINATDPDHNAWARFERGQSDLHGFALEFAAEAEGLGYSVDAREVLAGLAGELRPAMVEAVRRCSARFATACLSNTVPPGTAGPEGPEPRFAEVLALFDVVLQSASVGVRKPDPQFYELACTALGVAPAEVVFLDDLGINLKPARQMGMRTIKVGDPRVALEELEGVLGMALRD